MRVTVLILFLLAAALIYLPSRTDAQAPTFGPVCDGVTVTCIPTPSPSAAPTAAFNPTETPTPSPTETLTPTPTLSPTITPTPSVLPRSGHAENLMTVLGISALFIFGGYFFSKARI